MTDIAVKQAAEATQERVVYEPISKAQELQVTAEVGRYLNHASKELEISFAQPEVKFDLIGATAGMYLMRKQQRTIRFNPYLFAKYFVDSLATTVPHEVAHCVVEQKYGWRRVKPHGQEWRAVMGLFGVKPEVRCHYDMSGIPRRSEKRYHYRCDCRDHELTARRHNAITNNGSRYACRYCGAELKII